MSTAKNVLIPVYLSKGLMFWAFGLIAITANSPEGWAALSDKDLASCRESAQILPTWPGASRKAADFCQFKETLPNCSSVEGRVISHWQITSQKVDAKRILVFGVTHGDEPLSGTVAWRWMERLQEFSPRSNWRIVPILNPDGLRLKTRTNQRGVDLNRNFPTKDWGEEAKVYWQQRQKSDPRRYPGDTGGSEPETRCALAHLESFNPDLVVSLHTPYAVLDFDGPRVPFPRFGPLKWTSLGHYPGSLGRYMWKDHSLPVLTAELPPEFKKSDWPHYEKLQDLTYNLIQAYESLIPSRSASNEAGLKPGPTHLVKKSTDP